MQEAPAVPGVTDVVVPSPSGLNRMLLDEPVEHYRALTLLLAWRARLRRVWISALAEPRPKCSPLFR